MESPPPHGTEPHSCERCPRQPGPGQCSSSRASHLTWFSQWACCFLLSGKQLRNTTFIAVRSDDNAGGGRAAMCSVKLCSRRGHFAITLKVKGKEQMHQVWREHGRYPRHTQAPHALHRRPVATLPDAGREPPAPCVGQLRGRLSLPSRLRVECHMRACFYVGSCSFHVILFHNSVCSCIV